jgi:hypothetical protein
VADLAAWIGELVGGRFAGAGMMIEKVDERAEVVVEEAWGGGG